VNIYIAILGVLALVTITGGFAYVGQRRERKSWRRARACIDEVKFDSSVDGPGWTTVLVRFQPVESRTEITAEQTFCGRPLRYRVGESVEISYSPKNWWEVSIGSSFDVE
jgi:hypothetical protein